MRSFLEVSGLCSKSLFAVIEGTRFWPQIRKEILILPNLWTILRKVMEFRVCWQRRNLPSREDIWVISGRSRMIRPFWELLFGPHNPFSLLLQEVPKGKPQTQFHGLLLWPSNSPTRGRASTLCLSSRERGTAALWAPISDNMELFPPPKLESSGGTMKPWMKFPRNLLRQRAIPDHTFQRDFIGLLQRVYFWLTFSREPQEIWIWSISENTRAHPVHVREGSGSSLD